MLISASLKLLFKNIIESCKYQGIYDNFCQNFRIARLLRQFVLRWPIVHETKPENIFKINSILFD